MKGSPLPPNADHLPPKLAAPARRALENAGITRLEQLSAYSAADILQLHGMGPKAMDQLRRALAEQGRAFRDLPEPGETS